VDEAKIIRALVSLYELVCLNSKLKIGYMTLKSEIKYFTIKTSKQILPTIEEVII